MNLSRYYGTSCIEKRHHRQLITNLKSNLNKLEEVDLQTNGFIRVNSNKWIHIMRVSESTSSKHAIFLSHSNDKNRMIILRNVDHQIRKPKRSEFPNAVSRLQHSTNCRSFQENVRVYRILFSCWIGQANDTSLQISIAS